MYSAGAVGSLLVSLTSGSVSRTRRHGLLVVCGATGWTGARPAIWTGGVACVAAVGLLTAALARLVAYDARTDEDALRRAEEGNGSRTQEPSPT